MAKINDNIVKMSEDVLERPLIQNKSFFCTLVLRLMDTETYGNNYCQALNLVLELFPEIDRVKLEKELDKYI